MAEELTKISGSKSEIYSGLIPQIISLIGNEKDVVANLANVAAALKEGFDFLWVGFYLVKDDELVLGPFQGPVACTRIQKGRGVCGTAWAEAKTIVVEDVDSFLGHIACSSSSKSEIVVPLIKENKVVAVLDIDSDQLAAFNDQDAHHLNHLCTWLADIL